jgi:hypothetical protein
MNAATGPRIIVSIQLPHLLQRFFSRRIVVPPHPSGERVSSGRSIGPPQMGQYLIGSMDGALAWLVSG